MFCLSGKFILAMDEYVLLRVLGEGTFGRVYLARHAASSALVALKKVRIKRAEEGLPKVLMREIQALEKLSAEGESRLSRHVVQLRAHFAQGSAVVMALEYMRTDLQQVMHALATVGARMHIRAVRACMRMVLEGVAGVHAQKVMHRDLKPSNLLFSPLGRLKLGDFGLARVHLAVEPVGDYSHEVATRWYRSVELLLGARSYGFGVDVWSVGCIFAELLAGAPLFAGHNDIDQLYRVLRVRGTPTRENWPEHETMPDHAKISFPHMDPLPLDTLCHAHTTPADAIDLMERMLALDPARRISAADALLHPFFARAEDDERHPADGAAHTADEDMMRELASLPEMVKQWETEQQATRKHPATQQDFQQQGHTAHAAAAASSNSTVSAAAAPTESEQLRAMHLTGMEWAPSTAAPFARALQQMPPHVTRAGLLRPARLDDICAS